MIFIILASLKFIFLGAIYGRIDGGGVLKTKEIIERALVMFAFVLACSLYVDFWAFLALLGTFGIATGHGQYFLDRQLVGQKERVERLDFIVKWIFGKDWRENYPEGHKFTKSETEKYNNEIRKKLYWRNVFGMFLTGSLVGLPSGLIMLAIGQYIPAMLFFSTGIAKAFAYMVGNLLVTQETVFAEYTNGALRNLICLIVIIYYITGFFNA